MSYQGEHSLTGRMRVSRVEYRSWPTLVPVAGALVVAFDEYLAATVGLNSPTTITLNTPAAPGAFKLILEQDSVGGRAVTWATQGSEEILAPSGTLEFSTTPDSVTLLGFIWDGARWFVVSSVSMEAI